MPYPGVYKPIKRGNFRVSPFYVNKEWSVDNTSYSSSGYTLQQAVFKRGPQPYGTTTLSTFGQNFSTAGSVQHISNFYGADRDPINTHDGTYQHIIWHSLNHQYYKFPYNPANNFGDSNINTIEKRLFLSASSFTIPYFKVGESVKPKTLKVTDTTNDFILNDDGKGNLRDYLINSQSFALSSRLVGYWGFNDEYRKFKRANGVHSKSMIFDSNAYQVDITSQVVQVNFQPGIVTTGIDNAKRSGMQARFDGTSYIKTDAYKSLNFDSVDNFAISFWYGGNVSQSITSSNANSLITKRGVNDKLILNNNTQKREIVEENRMVNRYPFDIEVLNNTAGILENGKIRFQRSDGSITYSSASMTQCTGSDSEYHIVAQKSGSYLELWINGVREIQSPDPVSSEVRNFSKLMFGSMNTNFYNALSGSLDEIRIYNYGLSETAIKSLANNHYISSSAYQTSVAGNIFYKTGHVIISSNLPKYHNALGQGGNDTNATWRVDYKGTHVIWENEVLVEVPAGSNNVSMNPSAHQRANSDKLKLDFTGSLTPYITTIGLYNQDAQLLAIGKLGQPIAKRSDVDMNFIVRWDY